MSHTMNFEFVARIARRGLALAALLGLLFAGAAVSQAQSSAASVPGLAAKPSAAAVVPLSPAAKPPTALEARGETPKNAPTPPTEKPAAKGQHERIKVHGHWTIEVRNPDGSVDQHVEFENGLCPTTGGGFGNGGASGGDVLIATLMANTAVPGGWEILLGSPTIPSGPTPGPACNFTPVFSLLETNSALASGCAAPGCFPNLGAPTTGSAANVIILTGQFTVPSGSGNTQITAVGTGLVICPSQGNTATQCLTQVPGAAGINLLNFTGTYLTGVAPIPPAVTVSANQSVSATVQISFQ